MSTSRPGIKRECWPGREERRGKGHPVQQCRSRLTCVQTRPKLCKGELSVSPEVMKCETYQVALVHEVSGAEATFQGISSAEAGATRGPGVMPWKVLA